jgi:HAD superfamily hydrolase (TIGR01509 family)
VSLSGRIRAITFDLDGVLIHSTGCHRSAFEEVLRPFGIVDFDYSRYAGWRTPEVIAAEFSRCGVAADQAAIRAAAERKTMLARRKLAETNPVPADCRSVLEQLAKRYRLALASSGSHGSVHSFLTVNGFEGLFESVLSGDEVTHAKPDPEIYRRSFATLGIEPHACVVVEDAVAGIEAARRAGAEAIGVMGTSEAAALQRAGAAHIVHSLSELPDLMASL